MDLLINILRGLFVFVALLMLLVILMQRPKSEGLGAAFGGGVTENIFGAQTTNVLTKITGWLAAFFLYSDLRPLDPLRAQEQFTQQSQREGEGRTCLPDGDCFTDAGSHSRGRSGRLAHSQPGLRHRRSAPFRPRAVPWPRAQAR